MIRVVALRSKGGGGELELTVPGNEDPPVFIQIERIRLGPDDKPLPAISAEVRTVEAYSANDVLSVITWLLRGAPAPRIGLR